MSCIFVVAFPQKRVMVEHVRRSRACSLKVYRRNPPSPSLPPSLGFGETRRRGKGGDGQVESGNRAVVYSYGAPVLVQANTSQYK